MSGECRCGRIMLGLKDSGARNWEPACPEHGLDSEWYRTEGKAHLEASTARSVELQRQARESRQRARGQGGDA